MTKEYKKKQNVSQSSGLIRRGTLFLVVFLCGYFSASVITLSDVSQWASQYIKSSKPAIHASGTAVQSSPLPKPKFEFYTLLAKEQTVSPDKTSATTAQVKVAPDKKPQHTTKKLAPVRDAASVPAAKESSNAHLNNTNFLVQVASFKHKKDAERMKASLTLKGFDTFLTSVKRDNVTWYRVIIGPYQTRVSAEKAQVSVARTEHVMGMVRKMDG